MTNYIRAQTAGQIVRNAYAIYWRHFWTLFTIYFLPVFPFMTWAIYSQYSAEPIHKVGELLSWFVELLPVAAMAVAVSDISLGNQPSLVRSWRWVLGPLAGKLFITYILLTLAVLAGFLLLVVPGIVVMAWYMFSLTVVALERLGGREALRRSKELGKGFYARNLGVLLLLLLVSFSYYLVFSLLVEVSLGAALGMLFPESADTILESTWMKIVHSIIEATFLSLLTPPVYIGTVLLYFDMRSRKEAYDATILAEELRH